MPRPFSHALLLLAATVTACAPSATVRPGGQLTGAPSARHAVEQFMTAVRSGDIQAITVVWGTARGPTRDTMERNELERRAIILQCFLAHDQFQVLNDVPGETGRRLVRGEITRGSQTRQTTFTAVNGPAERWYVEAVDMTVLRDFCGEAGISR